MSQSILLYLNDEAVATLQDLRQETPWFTAQARFHDVAVGDTLERVARFRTFDQQLEALRDALAEKTGRPVTFGWGPRFLHSTGQYHKGGPAQGVFLQVTADHKEDLGIPERPYTFGGLITAQAIGDGAVLADAEHNRPVLRVNLTDRAAGIAALLEAAK